MKGGQFHSITSFGLLKKEVVRSLDRLQDDIYHFKILAPFHPFLTAQIYTGDGMFLRMKKKKWAEKFDL